MTIPSSLYQTETWKMRGNEKKHTKQTVMSFLRCVTRQEGIGRTYTKLQNERRIS